MCSERGGSNLLLRMLDAHPDYCGPAATHVLRIMLNNRSRYGTFRDDAEWERYVNDFVAVFKSNIFHWNSTVSAEVLLRSPHVETRGRSLAALIRELYESEAKVEGKSGVIIKENAAYNFVPYCISSFPECRYIYLVRDPRDVALSWKMRDWWWACGDASGARHAARVWRKDQQACLSRFFELQESGKVFLLRYEDLLLEPKQKLGALCSYLGIAFSDCMLNFHKTVRAAEDSKKRKVFRNLSKPLMSSNMGKFRTGLTEEETRWIEHTCQREMQLLGYARCYPSVDDFDALDEIVAHQEAERLKQAQHCEGEETQHNKDRVALLQGISAQSEPSLLPELRTWL